MEECCMDSTPAVAQDRLILIDNAPAWWIQKQPNAERGRGMVIGQSRSSVQRLSSVVGSPIALRVKRLCLTHGQRQVQHKGVWTSWIEKLAAPLSPFLPCPPYVYSPILFIQSLRLVNMFSYLILPSFTNIRCFGYFNMDYILTEMSEETH